MVVDWSGVVDQTAEALQEVISSVNVLCVSFFLLFCARVRLCECAVVGGTSKGFFSERALFSLLNTTLFK